MRLYILFILDTAFGWQTLLSPEQLKRAGIHPWVGVLKVRSGNTEFATGLILIAKRLAAAVSNDISKLDKQSLRISSRAVFFKHNVPWYCDVIDYQIHPEFNNDNLTNTLALLNLDCNRKVWTPINLPVYTPMDETKPNSLLWRNIYAIGLSDRNYDFEQIIYKMKLVNSSKCLDFYVKEEIDYKPLWPKHFFCFKAVNVKKQCVFDTGMVLASLNNGNWTLIGISVLGPGCVLPSRYIDILPYISWINDQKNQHTFSYRRLYQDEKNSSLTAIDPTKDIVSDVSPKEDLFYIQKLNNYTMVMRPRYANVRGVVHGDCLTNKSGIMMYRDAGLVRSSNKNPATGMYALSLYDMFYERITCVMVSVRCDKRSLTKFWYEKGFKADTLDDITFTIPHLKRGQTVPPKILFLTDTFYQYREIETANIVFKFEFTHEAAISVDFYGVLATTTPTSTTTTTTPRPPRTHPSHVRYTPALKLTNFGDQYVDRRKMYRTKKRFDRKNSSLLKWK